MPLPTQTLFTGRNVISLDKVDSTNSYAAAQLDQTDLPEGTVITAYEQTSGRGQRGNEWQSMAGLNLTFTLILSPVFLSPQEAFQLNIITSLAVLALVEELSSGLVHVKWPNDVLVNGKKVAGILIENNISRGRIAKSLIGTGINVNQESFDKLASATSLKAETGNSYPLEKVLARFCELFEPYYLKLRSGGSEALAQLYHKKLFGLNEWRDFEMEGNPVNARITGVDKVGKLCLETGREKFCCNMKEISYLL